ncbi:MAG TPA: NADAR family protein [Puia sp.]|nr:NADAR family protein [Puia sp.]
MRFDRKRLIEQYPDHRNIPFLFFYGHKPSEDGSITKSCFSQWWIAPFEVDGFVYRTAEHWMMAGKASLFGDNDILEKIRTCETPAKVKKLGRLVQDFDPSVWDRHKYDIVVTGSYQKFAQNVELKKFLLDTDDKILVEASPVDRIWGIGMKSDHPAATNPALWKGGNLLGFALMEARAKLRGI